MSKRKPMPKLERFPLYPREVPRVITKGIWRTRPEGKRVGITYKRFFLISTKWYKTERGARNGWNRMVKITKRIIKRNAAAWYFGKIK